MNAGENLRIQKEKENEFDQKRSFQVPPTFIIFRKEKNRKSNKQNEKR